MFATQYKKQEQNLILDRKKKLIWGPKKFVMSKGGSQSKRLGTTVIDEAPVLYIIKKQQTLLHVNEQTVHKLAAYYHKKHIARRLGDRVKETPA